MKLRTFAGIATGFGTALVGSAGCGDHGSQTPSPLSTQYVVNLEATSVSGLGSCTTANNGAVGLVTTTGSDGGVTDSLYYCNGTSSSKGTWTGIMCCDSNSGSVAYVPGSPGSLFVCSELSWRPVPIPPGATGPQGLQGDAGPRGPQGLQGDAGATGATGPTGANGTAGTNGTNGTNALVVQTALAVGNATCPNGGAEIQSGTNNGSGGFVGTPSTTYVCNGAAGATGATGAPGATGANGTNALVVQTVLAAGNAYCPNGGSEIQTGTADEDGGFAGSVTTTYVCNGAAQADAGGSDAQSGVNPGFMACEICLAQSCKGQTQACATNSACSPYLTCLTECGSQSLLGLPCAQACGAQYGSSAPVASLDTCAVQQCPGACSTCADGVLDGTETGVDCGGGVCGECGQGGACNVASDCQSALACVAGLCRTPTCSDGVQDGSETAVDCGGPVCAGCASGKACLVNSDCVSFECASGICDDAGAEGGADVTQDAGIDASMGMSCGASSCDLLSEMCCQGACIATYNDPNNCGGCGIACGGTTPFCDNGMCGLPACTVSAGCSGSETCCGTFCCGPGQLCCIVESNQPVTNPQCADPVNGTCPIGCPGCP